MHVEDSDAALHAWLSPLTSSSSPAVMAAACATNAGDGNVDDYMTGVMAAYNTHDNHNSATANSDVPLFLRDEDDGGACARGGGDAASAYTTTTAATATSAARSLCSGVAQAATPWTKRVHVCGASGHLWRLRKVQVIGKGAYGFATLYAQEAGNDDDDDDDDEAGDDATGDVVVVVPHNATATSMVPPLTATALQQPQHTSQLHTYRYIVMKSMDTQTMSNPKSELAALQSELQVLTHGMGHPNVVQLLDCCDAHASHRRVYVMLEYCARGDLAFLLQQAVMVRDGMTPSMRPRHTHAPRHPSTRQSRDKPDNACARGGDTWRDWIDDKGYVRERVVGSILIQLMVGLSHLHRGHCVHRDIKPPNLFLYDSNSDDDDMRTDGGSGSGCRRRCGDGAAVDVVLRIGDCGSAAVLTSATRQTVGMCGSTAYMAPEVHAHQRYGTAADVWSAGVTMYELIAHERPFSAHTTRLAAGAARLPSSSPCASLSASVMSGEHTSLLERRDHRGAPLPYSTPLLRLVEKMLTRRADERLSMELLMYDGYVRTHLRAFCPPCVRHTAAYEAIFSTDILRTPRALRRETDDTARAAHDADDTPRAADDRTR